MGTLLVAATLQFTTSQTRVEAIDLVVDTDALTVTRDGAPWDFGGALSTSVIDGKATFSIAGDFALLPGETLTGVGSRPASFLIGDDVAIAPGATIDFSAVETLAGAGGGSGGLGGAGGGAGSGATTVGEGGGLQFIVGGLSFNNQAFILPAVPPLIPAQDGRDGGGGRNGVAGSSGVAGVAGSPGFGVTNGAGQGGAGQRVANAGAAGAGGSGGEATPWPPQPVPISNPITNPIILPLLDLVNIDAADFFDDIAGAGGSGATGGAATSGSAGANGLAGGGGLNTGAGFAISGGAGGGAGSGGQGGGGGGSGGGGGGGASGQGAWAISTGPVPLVPPTPDFVIGGFGGVGASGGDGAAGASGGAGGRGGDGGGGGGAFEIVAQGAVDLDGSLLARGGAGQAGGAGSAGQTANGSPEDGLGALPGIPGWKKGNFWPFPFTKIFLPAPYIGPGAPGSFGGAGAAGATGGDGGSGGDGGAGGGGGGGSVKLVGTSVFGGGSIDTAGGLGGDASITTDDGGDGRFLVGTNTAPLGAAAASILSGPVTGAQGSSTQLGTLAPNPFIAGSPDTPTIVGLDGGAEAFGLLPVQINPSQLVLPDGSLDENGVAMLPGSTVLDADTDGDAVAGLVRYDVGPAVFGDFDYDGYDLLLLFNTGLATLDSPLLGVRDLEGVPVGDTESAEHYEPLLAGGFANDARFGGVMDQTLGTLDVSRVYGVLIPESADADHNFAFQVQSDDGGTITIASASVTGLSNGEYVLASSSPDKQIVNSLWNTPGNGAWSDPTKWDNAFDADGVPVGEPTLVPGNTLGRAFNVTIDAGNAVVTQDVSVVLDRLTIGTGNSLDVQNGRTLVVDMQPIRVQSGVIDNSGVITLQAAGATPNSTTLQFNGEVLLTGTGTLTSTDDIGNTISGFRRTVSLVNDAGHTMAVAGTLGDDRLLFDNRGTLRPVGVQPLLVNPTGDQARNTAAMRNSGFIDVSASGGTGQMLVLQDGFFHNESGGLISVRNAGALMLDSARLHNDGAVEFLSGATAIVTGTGGLSGVAPTFETSATFNLTGADFENRTTIGASGVYADSVIDNNGGVLGRTDLTQGTAITLSRSTVRGGVLAGQLTVDNGANPPSGAVTRLSDLTLEAGASLGVAGPSAQGRLEMSGQMQIDGDLSASGVRLVGDTVFSSQTASAKRIDFLNGSAAVTFTAGSTWTVDSAQGPRIENHATLNGVANFDASGSENSSSPGLVNRGVINGSVGGVLEFRNTFVDNADGVVQFDTAEFRDARVVGGTISGSELVLTDSIVESAQINAAFVDANNGRLRGVEFTAPNLQLDGSLALDNTTQLPAGDVLLAAALTLETDFAFVGSGGAAPATVELNGTIGGATGAERLTIGQGVTLLSDQNSDIFVPILNRGTIGVGPFGDDGLFIDGGTADAPGIVNEGLIAAAQLSGFVDNEGGRIDGLVDITGTTIRGGTVGDASDVLSGGGVARLEELTIDGQVSLEFSDVGLRGDVVLTGGLSLNGIEQEVVVDRVASLTGDGTLSFSDTTRFVSGSTDPDAPASRLTFGPDLTIDFTGFGTQAGFESTDLAVVNQGTIRVGSSGLMIDAVLSQATLPTGAVTPDTTGSDDTQVLTEATTFNAELPFTNEGTIEVMGGGLTLFDSSMDNREGTISLDSSSFFELLAGGLVNNDGGQIIGPGTLFLDGGTIVGGTIDVALVTSLGSEDFGGGRDTLLDVTVNAPVEFGGELVLAGQTTINGEIRFASADFGGEMLAVEGADTVIDGFTLIDLRDGIFFELIGGEVRTPDLTTILLDDVSLIGWQGGALRQTTNDWVIDPNNLLYDEFIFSDNPAVVLPSGSRVIIDERTLLTSGNELLIDGGSLTTKEIVPAAGGTITFNSGELVLTDSGLTVGAGGLLGPTVSLTAGKTIQTSQPTVVAVGGALGLDGGTLVTPEIVVDGELGVGADNASGDVTLTIVGGGTIRKQGAGAVALTDAATFAGGVVVEAGALRVTAPDQLAAATGVAIDAGATVELAQEGAFATPLSGAGRVLVNSPGVASLTGANTHTGGAVLASGTLGISQQASLGSGDVRFDGGTLRIEGTSLGSLNNPLDIADSDVRIDVTDATHTFTIDQSLVGADRLSKLGEGTLRFDTSLDLRTTGAGASVTVEAGTLAVAGVVRLEGVNGANVAPGGGNGANGSAGGAFTLAGGALGASGVNTFGGRGGNGGAASGVGGDGGSGGRGGSGDNVTIAGGVTLGGVALNLFGGDGGAGRTGNNGSGGFNPTAAGNGGNGGDGGNAGTLLITSGSLTIAGGANLSGGDGGNGANPGTGPFGPGILGRSGRGGSGGSIVLSGGELVYSGGVIDLRSGFPGSGLAPTPPAPDGFLRIQGGQLTTTAVLLDGAFSGNASFTSGTLRLTEPVFTAAVGTRTSTLVGSSLSASQTLLVDNAMVLPAGRSLIVTGGRLSAGTIDRTAGGVLGMTAGRLEAGAVLGDLDSNLELGGGVFAPSANSGPTLIDGDYTESASSTLEIDVAGVTVGSGYDQLEVTGGATLAGTLELLLDPAFMPASADTFTLLTADELTGAFANVASGERLDTTGGVGSFRVDYSEATDSVVLSLFATLAGDYNEDGSVDGADYTVWRDRLGAPAGTLPNDTDGGVIGEAQYVTWAANFGALLPGPSQAVPEPSGALLIVASAGLCVARPLR
ncbi:MAG: hypothetical protein AAFV43_01510 [Planctomycetota bacterium]